MEVELLGVQSQISRAVLCCAVLKLFDRRFAMVLRTDKAIGQISPLTAAKEKAFSDFVNSGSASEFLDQLRNDDDSEESDEEWDMGQHEAYLYNWLRNLYETEAEVYGELERLQGREIPSLLAEVRLRTGPPNDEVDNSKMESSENVFEVKGLSLEHIEGYKLSDIADNAPREDWGRLCE
jgi:hypothetical protein